MTDEEEIAQTLQRIEAEATELQGRLDARRQKDDEACDALALELSLSNRKVELSASQRQATQNRIDRMVRERRPLVTSRARTWMAVQLAIRLLLALFSVVAFLMFVTNDVLAGWPLFGVLVTDFAFVWFVGDLADYLELSHG